MDSANGQDQCPDLSVLEDVARGITTDESLTRHLLECEACRKKVDEIASDNDLLSEFVVANATTFQLDAPVGSTPDSDIPGYEIEGEIHRGGQGVVYKATQIATKRTVAVKTLLHGAFATTRQRIRFEREVELAAGLVHPAVVTVFESGVTSDGRHYLAMEYVEGETLDVHVARLRDELGQGRVFVDRLFRLFERICDGVNYAHQRGVIHRDLKPSNIIVDAEGAPHVLDFGVAKAVGSEAMDEERTTTMPGEFVGTLAYASPEQVLGDSHLIDIRSDVYALGVILYEALTGQRPYKLAGSLADVVYTISEVDPPSPTSINPELTAEVNAIVMHTIRKSVDERYQSARALYLDLDRFLRGVPIEARRDNALYVFRKNLYRYRVPVAIAATFVLLIVTFAINATRQASIERGLRKESAARLLTITNSLGTFDQETSELADIELQSLADLLDVLDEFADETERSDPIGSAQLRAAIGTAYLGRESFEIAEDRYRQTLTQMRGIYRKPHADVAEAHHNLARSLWKQGRYEEAQVDYREALRLRLLLFGAESAETAHTTHHLASTLQLLDQFDESVELYEEAIRVRRQILGADHPQVANTLMSLGGCLRDAGHLGKAATRLRESLEIIRTDSGPDDWRVSRVEHVLAMLYIDLAEFDKAEPMLDDSLRIKRLGGGDEDLNDARGYYEFARLDYMRGEDMLSAEAQCRRALDLMRGPYASGHWELAQTHGLLSRILLEQGRRKEALAEAQLAVGMSEAVNPPNHWRVGWERCGLGAALAANERLKDAWISTTDGLEIVSTTRPPGDWRIRWSLEHAIELARAMDDAEAARSLEIRLASARDEAKKARSEL